MTNHDHSTQLAKAVERAIENDALRFLPDTMGIRTKFRDAALNYIFRAALELCDGRLKSAEVSVSSTPDEEDSLILDLTLTVDADWETIGKLRRDVLVKLGEWSQEWSAEEKEDYGQRIYFGLIPISLSAEIGSGNVARLTPYGDWSVTPRVS